jgi:hypothetical protein
VCTYSLGYGWAGGVGWCAYIGCYRVVIGKCGVRIVRVYSYTTYVHHCTYSYGLRRIWPNLTYIISKW